MVRLFSADNATYSFEIGLQLTDVFSRKFRTTDLFGRVIAQGGCEAFVLEDLRTWIKSWVSWSNLTAYPTFSKRWDYRFPKINSNLNCPIILEKHRKLVDKQSSAFFFFLTQGKRWNFFQNLNKKFLFALCLTQNCWYGLNSIWLIQSIDSFSTSWAFNLLSIQPLET